MPLSVRLPLRVEQKLADYCARSGETRTDIVTRALDRFLEQPPELSPYERAIAAGWLKEPVSGRRRRKFSLPATNKNVRAVARMSRDERRRLIGEG